jgi:hypothetical protein
LKDKLLSVFKFVLAILLLPFVIGVTAAFMRGVTSIDGLIASAFAWGVVAYLILHMMFYQPSQVFDAGKQMSEKALGFMPPVIKVTGFCIPFFTILAFVLYIPVSKFWDPRESFPSFIFLAAFAFTMHMVFTANALKGKSAGWLKENYLLSIFLIYIVNMTIIAVAFSFLVTDFSLGGFFTELRDASLGIFRAVFEQLFVVR